MFNLKTGGSCAMLRAHSSQEVDYAQRSKTMVFDRPAALFGARIYGGDA